MSELPTVTLGDRIAAHDGARVRLCGTYVELDVRMAPRPPPRFDGHAAVRLTDGTIVTIMPVWHPAARRTADERDACRDRAVEVIGTLHASAPREPHGGACPIGPAITDVESVRAAG